MPGHRAQSPPQLITAVTGAARASVTPPRPAPRPGPVPHCGDSLGTAATGRGGPVGTRLCPEGADRPPGVRGQARP